MNKTLKLLMISDILVLTGFGLIDPILAIFVNDHLVGGTIFAAGFASTLFLITKSIVQLPFSRHVDRQRNKKTWLIIGTILIAIVPFLYIIATDVSTIYVAQVVHGIGSGLAYATWLGLWSTNLDRNKESFQWSLYSTVIGIGTALSAVVGAAIAELVGFGYTFLAVGVMSMIGCLILFYLDSETKKKTAGKQRSRKKFVKGAKLHSEEHF